MAIIYEWDDEKAAANLAKHDVTLSDAEGFDWTSSKTIFDAAHSDAENRFLTYGFIDARLHVMYWTPRGERVRIIGLRKANSREVKAYAQKT